MEPKPNKGGRPAIGATRKVSITLPIEVWSYIESEFIQEGKTLSAAPREMVEENYMIHRVNEVLKK